MATNFYDILGVSRSATTAEIRSRFLALARRQHPDRFPPEDKERAEEEFQILTEAFNVLTQPERRREHDAELARPVPARPTSAKQDELRVHLQRGVQAFKAKNYREAASHFDRATKVKPDDAKAWYNLAMSTRHDPRHRRQAIAAAAKACELEAMNPKYQRLAGKLHAEAGLTSDARRYYNEALRWGGADPEVEKALAALDPSAGKKSGFFSRRR